MTYADKVTSLNPLAYYRFNETSGTTAVDETGTYNGTYNGSPTLGATGLNVNDSDTAVSLDGVDDYVDIPVNNIGTGNYTLSCLLEMPTDPTSSNYSVIRQHGGTNAAILIQITTSNVLAFYQYDGADKGRTEYTISSGTKYHVVGVRQGTNSYLYVNGVLVSSATDAISISPLGNFNIGRHPGASNEHFDGTIDEVAIFDTALAETDILELYALSRIDSALYLNYQDLCTTLGASNYYPLNEQSGTVFSDAIGSKDGSYIGTVTVGEPPLLTTDAGYSVDFQDFGGYGLTGSPQFVSGSISAISMFINTGTLLTDGPIFGLLGGRSSLRISVGTGNLSVLDGPSSAATWSNAFTPNETAHIAANWDSSLGVTKIYKNGVLLGTAPFNMFANHLDWDLLLGTREYLDAPLTSEKFNGRIDAVSLYPTTLTDDQIRTLAIARELDLTTLVPIAPTTTYADKINSLSPLVYYRLGEASGTIATDSSSNGNNGTYNGSPTLSATGLNVNDSDTAVDFDGVDDYVSVPTSVAAVGSSPRTIVLICDGLTLTGQKSLYCSGENSSLSPWVFNISQIGAELYVYAGAGVQAAAPITLADFPMHIVATYDGADIKMYINGALAASVSAVISTSTTTDHFFGRRSTFNGWSADYTEGTIDEAAIFDTALAETDILELYALSRIPATNYHTHSDAISSLSPLAYYRLGEASGTTAADSSGNGNDGTYNGTPTFGATGLVPYDSDSSVDFDGVDDYVDTPINNIGTGDYTLSCLLEMDTDPTSSAYAVISQYDGASQAITLQVNTSNDLSFYQYNSGVNGLTQYNISSGTKYHVVGVRQGTNSYLYVNGVLVSSATDAISISPSGNFGIGRDPGSGHFDGTIDEAVIFDTALTADEVSLLYTSSKIDLTTLAPAPTTTYADKINSLSPLAYWRLGEASGTTAADETGSYPGTYNGSPTLGVSSLNVNDANTSVTFDRALSQYVACGSIPGIKTFSALLTYGGMGGSISLGVFSVGSADNDRVLLQIINSGVLRMYHETGVTASAESDITLVQGQTYHVVMMTVGGTTVLYVDGARQSNEMIVDGFATTNTDLHVGTHVTVGSPTVYSYNGTLDEVAVFDSALTETDILELYALSRIQTADYAAYGGVVNSLSPFAYYRLNETSGTTAVDSSGNGNDGSINGSPTLGTTGLIPYSSDTAINFDGVDDYVDTPVNNIGTGDYTLSCLLEMDTGPTSGSYSVIRQHSGTSAAILLQINTSNNLQFYQFDGAVRGVVSYNISSGVKYHIVAVRQGGINYLYINGALATFSAGAISISPSGNFNIGRYPGGASEHFDGTIDEVAIYNTALTAEEVSLLYTASKIDLTTFLVEAVWAIPIVIQENLISDSWVATAINLEDGSIVVQDLHLSAGPGTYNVELDNNYNSPTMVVVRPDIGNLWNSGATIGVGDLVYPTEPSVTTKYFKCIVAGTTGGSEPTWDVSSTGAQTTDGSVTWELVESIVQPIARAPLFPAEV